MLDNYYIGQIIQVAFDYAPPGWMKCEGQVLRKTEYPTLFSVIGNHFTTQEAQTSNSLEFSIPDLRGRLAIHPNPKGNFTDRHFPQELGWARGDDSFKLDILLEQHHIPDHQHHFYMLAAEAFGSNGSDSMIGTAPIFAEKEKTRSVKAVELNNRTIGGMIIPGKDKSQHPISALIPIEPPSVGVNHLIAVEGIFPPRP